jgi:hypothetical protein
MSEFILFAKYYEPNTSVSKFLKTQMSYNFMNGIPNMIIHFRIYLAIFGTYCEGERSFFVLKRIKNCQRSTDGQNRQQSLDLLLI